MTSTFDKNRLKNVPKISYEESLKLVDLGKWNEHRKKQGCLAKAASTPLPGPLLGAFMDKSIMVRDKAVCRIVPAHFFVLQKIESKLLGLLSAAEADRQASMDISVEEQFDLCWIFTNDPAKVFGIVRDGGLPALREQSKSIGIEWEAEMIDCVIMAVMEQLKRHVMAKVQLVSDLKEKGEISFFQEPPKAAIMTPTPVDGSLPISANSSVTTPAKPSSG